MFFLFAWLFSCYQDWILTEHDFYNYDLRIESFSQPETDEFDILWVLDYSGSMQDQKKSVLSGLDLMRKELPSSDWRLGIVASDSQAASDWDSVDLVITPFSDDADLDAAYSIQSHYIGEEGLDASWTYIEFNQYASMWMRQTSPLLIVFVSDEEDSSIVMNYLSWTEWLKGLREQVYVSSIVTLNTDDCSTGDSVGTKYIATAQIMNGEVIDICSSNWDKGVSAIADYAYLQEFFALSEQPEIDSINVFVDKQRLDVVDWIYHYDTNEIEIPDFELYGTYGSSVEIVYLPDDGSMPTYDLIPLN